MRGHSFRDRAFLVAILVGAAPFLFLVTMTRLELHQAEKSKARVQATLEWVGQQRDSGVSWEAIDSLLRAQPSASQQHIRVATRAGQVLLDVDRSFELDGWHRLDVLLYGPIEPVLSSVERESGPLSQRPESLTGHDDRFAVGGNFLVHAVNQWRSETQVHVQGFSRRAVMPQITRERQVIKWLSVSLAIAIFAGWVLSRQLIKPLETLRDELLARASTAMPQAGLTLNRSDEVGDLANAFNTLLTALDQRNKANEAFLTDLAHELKNPVAAIRTSAELMASGAVSEERAAKLTEVLRVSSDQLDRLVTQFLELSRAEAGLPAEPRESFSLHALLDGLQRSFSSDPRFSTVEWRGTRSTSRETVHGIPVRLERAFGNLMLNALSFAGTTGWVQIDTRTVEGELEVVIQDSGPGIEASQLPRLFERFHTTRGEAKGTGLGLAMTRAIIEAHGGRISATSPATGGAAFWVRLPTRARSA